MGIDEAIAGGDGGETTAARFTGADFAVFARKG
jgi:hypothetical protein